MTASEPTRHYCTTERDAKGRYVARCSGCRYESKPAYFPGLAEQRGMDHVNGKGSQ